MKLKSRWNSEHSHHPHPKLFLQLFLPPFIFSPRQSLICFLQLQVSLLYLELHLDGIIWYVLLFVWILFQHNTCEIHSCCIYEIEFIPFFNSSFIQFFPSPFIPFILSSNSTPPPPPTAVIKLLSMSFFLFCSNPPSLNPSPNCQPSLYLWICLCFAC